MLEIIAILSIFFLIMWLINSYWLKNIKVKSKQIIISQDSIMSIDDILDKLDTVLLHNETIIITDKFIVERDDLRRVIHEKCEKLGIKSKTIRVTGGTFMTILPESPYLGYFTEDELALFVKYSGLPIDKKMIKYRHMFDHSMDALNDFYENHGNRDKDDMFKIGKSKESPNYVYNTFFDLKNNLKGSQSIMSYFHEIETKIIDNIKSKKGYIEFNNSENNKKQLDYNMQNTNPYKIGIKEEWKISIDIISANFTVLKIHDPNIFDGFNEWIDYVRQFTDSEFIASSKVFRQELFGKLNIKKIATKQKELLMSIVGPLIDAGIIIEGCINTDEIIIKTSRGTCLKDKETIMTILNNFENFNSNIFKVNIFRILPVCKTSRSSFYPFVKQNFIKITDSKAHFWTEFVFTPKFYILQTMKFWQGLEIQKEDLALCDEFGDLYYAEKSKFD